ncbi:MAG: hypothetical protein JO354_13295 [Verrucomicrobia bacterium]|nr:hypothetical protein [Verrucomicrobiota bacterium]
MTGWEVVAAMLMPDHVHLLIAPLEDRYEPVGVPIGFLKRRIRRKMSEYSNWQWQSGSFDRLLRSDESAESKWQYIRENPVRAGLVQHWSEWPYQIGFQTEMSCSDATRV